MFNQFILYRPIYVGYYVIYSLLLLFESPMYRISQTESRLCKYIDKFTVFINVLILFRVKLSLSLLYIVL